MVKQTATVASAATVSGTTAGVSGAAGPPLFLLEQEIPDAKLAVERARASLREWDALTMTRNSLSISTLPGMCSADTGCMMACRHIHRVFPEVLHLDFGVCQTTTTSTSTTSAAATSVGAGRSNTPPPLPSSPALWLSHPIHALHLQSQGLTDLTKSATALAKQQQQQQHASVPLSSPYQHSPHHAPSSSSPNTASAATATSTAMPPPKTAMMIATTQPILYGNEQERALAARLPGVHEIWHPAQQEEYSLMPLAAVDRKRAAALKAMRARQTAESAAAASHAFKSTTTSLNTADKGPFSNDDAPLSAPTDIEGKGHDNKDSDYKIGFEPESLVSTADKPAAPFAPNDTNHQDEPTKGSKSQVDPPRSKATPLEGTTKVLLKPKMATYNITGDSFEAKKDVKTVTSDGSIVAPDGSNDDAPVEPTRATTSPSATVEKKQEDKEKEKRDLIPAPKAEYSRTETEDEPRVFKDKETVTPTAATATEKHTTTTNSVTSKADVNDQPPVEQIDLTKKLSMLYALPSDVFRRYQAREENTKAVRKGIFAKRQLLSLNGTDKDKAAAGPSRTSTPSPSRKTNGPAAAAAVGNNSKGAAATGSQLRTDNKADKSHKSSPDRGGPDKKRRKLDNTPIGGTTVPPAATLTQLNTYQVPAIRKVVPPTVGHLYKQAQIKAAKQGETWLSQYRLAVQFMKEQQRQDEERRREERARATRNGIFFSPRLETSSFGRHYVFGAVQEENADEVGRPSLCEMCQTGRQLRDEHTEPITIHCLECGFLACLRHMRRHMALRQHYLGVNVSPLVGKKQAFYCSLLPRWVYCFHCNDFYHHVVFLQEEERIALEDSLPWMAWKLDLRATSIYRSFDPMRFVRIPSVGIFWNGFHATYPIDVPKHHVQASRAFRLRYQLVNLTSESLSKSLGDGLVLPNNSTTRNRGLARELALVVREKIRKPVGMYNLGNTCFQSAVFQCLIHCQPLQNFFLHKVGHAWGACRVYRRHPSAQVFFGKKESSLCLACEMDKIFLLYQSRSGGINVFKAMDDLTKQATTAPSVTPALVSDPLSVLRSAGVADGAVVERVNQGESLVAQKDILAATWKCKDMSHLAGYEQRDAHEFLHAFLEVLGHHTKHLRALAWQTLNRKGPKKKGDENNEDDAEPNHPNVIQNLFQGTLRSILLCQECGLKRIQKESFLSISLDLSKEVHFSPPVSSSSVPSSGMQTRKLSVEKCLLHFTTPEELLDPVDCPECERKTKTKKQHVISKLPSILCLHLKRFHGITAQKMEDFVSFPARELNMGAYLPHWREDSGLACGDNAGQSPIEEAPPPAVSYSLFATVNHFGNLQSGHYVANVKIENQWYHCNDAHVGYTTESQVLQGNAYLLFYKRDAV